MIKYENYDDYLCFWRCLSYHYDKPSDVRNVNKKLKQLFSNYYGKAKDIKTYDGVEYVAYKEQYDDLNNDEYDKKNDELDLIERFFKININVYTNDEPDIFMIDRRSINLFEDSINLLRYNNHFMYIKNMDQMRHCYKCKKCNKIFKCDKECNRHEIKCNILVQHEFKGGVYQPNQGVFKNIVIDEEDKYYPYEICYDFEAMVRPLKEIKNAEDQKLKITMEHVPVSVSILSNVPGYEQKPIFHCNNNPEELINDFVKTIYDISKKAETILLEKYKNIIKRLEDKDAEKIKNWCSVIPVVSFNGSKYDINLMKKYLHKSLNNYCQNVDFAIKKSNSYMSLKTENLQFLDIRSYLAPNYSYDAFIKAYKCKLEKGFFPYDWFDNYDKLNFTELPEHKYFYNKLKGKNISDEDYKTCLDAWKNNNMKTFKDFLEWYNNLDVIPFVEAIEKMKVFYKNKKLDLFKDGVSLPGLVLKYLINSTKDEFYLFDEKDKIDDRET